jgi:peptide-methionine (S)-S-oxide reductase
MNAGARRVALFAPLLALTASCAQSASAEGIVRAPVAAVKSAEARGLQTAVFSGGCFWGVEGVFSHVKGVRSAVAGYRGGSASTASYSLVSTGTTGHAESVKVVYDPSQVRYDQLLQVFFSVVADPTERDRQGPDTGSQYRTALVPLNEAQRRVAAAYLAQLQTAHVWKRPLVARIEPAQPFFPAEAYHQDFMALHPDHPYILQWDAAKVAGLKQLYPTLYRPAASKG